MNKTEIIKLIKNYIVEKTGNADKELISEVQKAIQKYLAKKAVLKAKEKEKQQKLKAKEKLSNKAKKESTKEVLVKSSKTTKQVKSKIEKTQVEKVADNKTKKTKTQSHQLELNFEKLSVPQKKIPVKKQEKIEKTEKVEKVEKVSSPVGETTREIKLKAKSLNKKEEPKVETTEKALDIMDFLNRKKQHKLEKQRLRETQERYLSTQEQIYEVIDKKIEERKVEEKKEIFEQDRPPYSSYINKANFKEVPVQQSTLEKAYKLSKKQEKQDIKKQMSREKELRKFKKTFTNEMELFLSDKAKGKTQKKDQFDLPEKFDANGYVPTTVEQNLQYTTDTSFNSNHSLLEKIKTLNDTTHTREVNFNDVASTAIKFRLIRNMSKVKPSLFEYENSWNSYKTIFKTLKDNGVKCSTTEMWNIVIVTNLKAEQIFELIKNKVPKQILETLEIKKI